MVGCGGNEAAPLAGIAKNPSGNRLPRLATAFKTRG